MLSRDLILYPIELVISDMMHINLVDLRHQKKELGLDVEWKDAVEMLSKQLKNLDTHFLAESVFTVQRDNQSTLIKWLLFFIGMMKYCMDTSIILHK